jgi:hypothetical protein
VALNVVLGVDVGIGMCESVGILSQCEHNMSQRKLTRSSQGATWELVTVVGNYKLIQAKFNVYKFVFFHLTDQIKLKHYIIYC